MLKKVVYYFAMLFLISNLVYDVMNYFIPGYFEPQKKFGFYFAAFFTAITGTFIEWQYNKGKNKQEEAIQ